MNNAIYVMRDGERIGPYERGMVRSMLDSGSVSQADLAWTDGLADWMPLSSLVSMGVVPGRATVTVAARPRVARAALPVEYAALFESEKRLGPALILWFFFGMIGAHYFYLGRTGQGLLYISLILGAILGAGMAGAGSHAGIGGLPTVGGVMVFGCIALLFAGVFVDFFRIVCGSIKDGGGLKVSKWF